MDHDLPPKHNLESDDDEHPHAFTRLPPEILLDIFDYLKPQDDCMKKLSEVCKNFYNLCSPRLRVLQLDFIKICRKKHYPVIQRAYTEIRISSVWGRVIGEVLESSEETARKLVIKGTNRYCKINTFTIPFILRSLPNLEEVELNSVVGLLTQTRSIKLSERPELPNLRKLTLTELTAEAWSAFAKAENIVELRVTLGLIGPLEEKIFTKFVSKQKNLKLLDLWVYCPIKKLRRYLISNALIGGNDVEGLLHKFPKLEHLKLCPSIEVTFAYEFLSAGPAMPCLKTVEIRHNFLGNFDIEQILKKCPSLESFQSFNHRWSANMTAKKE